MEYIKSDWEIINELKKEKNECNEKLFKKDSEIQNLNKIIFEKDKKIKELKEKCKDDETSNTSHSQLTYLLDELKENKKKLKLYKSVLPFDIQPGEKLMCVIFISVDQKLHFPIICKNTDIFTRLENVIYHKFPEFSETENYFIANGIKINKNKSLDFNHIKDNEIITLKQFDLD